MGFDHDERIAALKGLTMMLMEPRPFHNFAHALEVTGNFRKIGTVEGLSDYDIHVGTTAGILHDIVCVPYRRDNEEKSALVARAVLPRFGYTRREVRDVERLIMATKMPVRPVTACEKVICDSDLDNLGSYRFFERNYALAREYGIVNRNRWITDSLKFIEGHSYHTETSKAARGSGEAGNVYMMREVVKGL